MADTRGLAVNRDIYDFETMMYRVYDNLRKAQMMRLQASKWNTTGGSIG